MNGFRLHKIAGCCLAPLLLYLAGLAVVEQDQAVNDGHHHGDPPFLLEEGWEPLLNGETLDGWALQDPDRGGWGTTSAVFW